MPKYFYIIDYSTISDNSQIKRRIKMDLYGFYTGTVFDAYEYLGAHRQNKGYVFRVFAPGAHRVALL